MPIRKIKSVFRWLKANGYEVETENLEGRQCNKVMVGTLDLDTFLNKVAGSVVKKEECASKANWWVWWAQ